MSAAGDTAETTKLRERLQNLSGYDWETAAKNPAFGALDFTEVVPVLRAGAVLLERAAKADLNLLPQSRVNQIMSMLNGQLATLSDIKNFNISQDNAGQRRRGIINSVNGNYEQLFENLAPLLGIWGSATKNIDQFRLQIAESLEETRRSYDAALQAIKTAREEATQTLEALKKAAGQVGVTENAKIFETQASEHKTSSGRWAIVTVAMAVATVAWGFVALWLIPTPPGADTAKIVQEAIAKLIVFSGLSYALVWCARNYSANRHNYVLNKHRQNSLTTFETFVKAAGSDTDTKNAVLLQATTAIFSAQATGYSAKDVEVDQPNKILEIIRSAKSSG